MSGSAATVETLTAEVRVLMVGSRQIALSVFKQLDIVALEDISPFGRTRSGVRYRHIVTDLDEPIELVDASLRDGTLVRSWAASPLDSRLYAGQVVGHHTDPVLWDHYATMPLIVLAGLK